MAAPRPPVNGATNSVGFTSKLVTVQAISPDGKTAVAVDRQNTQVNLPMLVQRSKGLLPAVGETWLASQDLGSWTFSAIVAQSASQFQTASQSSGVYTGATPPGNPSVGELWVNAALGNLVTAWNGTSWAPLQFGGTAIQPGSLTGAQLSQEANIAASQVNFTASDIGGITTTISATAPANPSVNDLWYNAENGYQLNSWTGIEWTPYQWGTQSISARAITAELIAANTITAEELAAGIIYGGIINGTIVDAATFIGSVFEGTDFILNEAGGFWYSSTPGLGNLFVNITSQPGSDGQGNPYQAGIFLYGPSGSYAALIDNGGDAALLLNPPGATALTFTPQAFSFTTNPGAANEYTWLVITSGKENGNDDAAIQLYSESADGTIPAHMIIEFGGTVFATITRTGLVLPVVATPPVAPGSASLYGTNGGTLQVMDGTDGEAYGTERRSIVPAGDQNITSTNFGTWASSTVAAASVNHIYRIHGKAFVAPNQTGGKAAFRWTGPAGATGNVDFFFASGTATGNSGGLDNGVSTSGVVAMTMTSGQEITVFIDGAFTVPAGASGTFALQAACATSGDTFIVRAYSFVDIMPV